MSTTSDGAACSCASCPYLPFSARICLNQHHWLANRMREEDIDFQQCSNAFMRCARPERLQELADELSLATSSSAARSGWPASRRSLPQRARTRRLPASAVLRPGRVLRQSRLPSSRRARQARRTAPRRQSHHRPAKQDHDDLRPQGHQAAPRETANRDRGHGPANPVIRSHYRNGFIKQYVRDHLILRTEASTNNVTDYGVRKAVDNLPALRSKLSAINDNYFECATGHRRDVPRPRSIAKAGPADNHPHGKAHSRSQARQSAATRADARSRPLQPTSPPATASLLPNFTPGSSRRSAAAPIATPSPLCATISPNFAPRASSKSCRTHAAIGFFRPATRSASSSSSFSNASTPR